MERLVEKRSTTLEVQPKEWRLLDFLELDKIEIDTFLMQRENLHVTPVEEAGKFGVILFNTKIMFPGHAKSALQNVLSKSGSFRPSDLDCTYSDESKVVLCKRLVKEGLLTFAARA